MEGKATLTRLNGDSSWLLTLPGAAGGQAWNALIDPWLDAAEQIDFHPRFSSQSRTVKALAQDVPSLEKQIGSHIDACVICHEFSDHAHPPTLAALPPSVKVLASQRVSKMVKQHVKEEVHALPNAPWDSAPAFGRDEASKLPANVQILALTAREWAGPAWGPLHCGLLIRWQSEEQTRCIIYSPHGILPSSIPPWVAKDECMAYLVSWDSQVLPFWLAGTVALGLQSALKVVEMVSPRALISTHDERKTARGIVAWLLKCKPLGGLDPASPAPEGDAVEPEIERARRAQKQLDQLGVDTTAYALAVGQHLDF